MLPIDHAAAQPTPYLVGDINPAPLTRTGSQPGGPYPGAPGPYSFFSAQLGAVVVFPASDPVFGSGLWRTDGTTQGTARLADVFATHCVGLGNLVLFTGNTPGFGSELWRSDGTTEGTRILADIAQGPTSSSPAGYVSLGDIVLFAATSPEFGSELWRTDGTESGTFMLADLRPGPSSSSPGSLIRSGDTVFFRATIDATGSELWMTDGTAVGTVLLADIRPGSDSAGPQNFVAADDGRIFFLADDGTTGLEVWVSDGTAAGTHIVADLCPGTCSGANRTGSMAMYDGRLYFSYTTPAYGRELWSTDGSESGTQLVADLAPGTSSSSPTTLAVFSSLLWFVDAAGSFGRLYSTAGTAQTTMPVGPALPGTLRVIGTGPKLILSQEDWLSAPIHERIWSVNDSANDLVLARDFGPDPLDQLWRVGGLGWVGNSLVCSAGEQTTGLEPWITDGTPGGTRLLRDIYDGPAGTTVGAPAVLGSQILFSGYDDQREDELWSAQATPGSASLVRDLFPGSYGSDPGFLRTVGNRVLFSARAAEPPQSWGTELWSTDGTAAGTMMVRDLNPGGDDGVGFGPIIAVGARVFFDVPWSAEIGRELGWSDGTAAGTDWVNISPASSVSSYPASNFWGVALGSIFITNPNDGTHGAELWRSDGSRQGTALIKDILPGTSSALPSGSSMSAAVLDQFAYLPANDGIAGSELWRTDGTEAGTTIVADLNPGPPSSQPVMLGTLGARVIFIARNAESQYQFWSTDGTPAGTSQLSTIDGGFRGTISRSAVLAGSYLYKVLDDGVHGSEIWATDGTAEGTHLVADLTPGPVIILLVADMIPVGRRVFFGLNDPMSGKELWTTDGTERGTFRMTDPSQEPRISSCTPKAAIGSTLFFTGYRADAGHELFAISTCLADWNDDGSVDGIDFDLFVSGFESGDADFNRDGFIDGIDYDLFMIEFEAGC